MTLLRDRSFRLLWAAHTTSSFGDALTSLTLLLLAHRVTGSAAAVAATAVAIALPQLLVGLFAGVLVDRWNRRRVMIVSDLLRAALVLGFIGVSSGDRIWLLYVIAFVQAAVGTFFNPARAALVADVLSGERLLAANSLSDMSRVVAGVAGVALAGLLASAGSLAVVFVIDAATFLVSATLLVLLAPPLPPPQRQPARSGIRAELTAGLVLIRRSRLLAGVVAAGAVAMFGLGAVNVLLVPFVVDDLGASEAWFGALEAAMVAAMVVSGLAIVSLSGRMQPTRLITAGALGLGASVAGLALTDAPWQLLPLMLGAGASITPLQAAVTTLLQTNVPDDLRARSQAAFSTLVGAASLASISLAGTAAALVGVRGVLVAAGAIVLAAAAAAHLLFRSAPICPRPIPELR